MSWMRASRAIVAPRRRRPSKETPEAKWDFWASDANTHAIWTSFGAPLSQRQNKQVVEALGNIKPKPDRRQECEHETERALRSIAYVKKTESFLLSSAAKKKLFLEKAESLRLAAEVLVTELSTMAACQEFVSVARVKAKAYESSAAEIFVQSRVPTQSKVLAVYHAECLLVSFGNRGPGLTPEGLWHQLAEILYGVKGSIDAGYLRRERERQKELRAVQSPFCLLRLDG
jgi:hypothetical protein